MTQTPISLYLMKVTKKKYDFRKDSEIMICTPLGFPKVTIDIELALSYTDQLVGLMFRESLPEFGGMLFPFEYNGIHGFVMKNTNIALDMLFINEDGRITDIHHNIPPSEPGSFRSTLPVNSGLEVNGGLCKRLGIEVGDLIKEIES